MLDASFGTAIVVVHLPGMRLVFFAKCDFSWNIACRNSTVARCRSPEIPFLNWELHALYAGPCTDRMSSTQISPISSRPVFRSCRAIHTIVSGSSFPKKLIRTLDGCLACEGCSDSVYTWKADATLRRRASHIKRGQGAAQNVGPVKPTYRDCTWVY